jgi:hypothetical protein
MTTPYVLVTAVVVGGLLAACSHDRGNQCGDDLRYTRARTVAPVRIPDDLSPPDETDSLRLPEGVAPQASAAADSASEQCLETPPQFGETAAGRARSAQPPASAPGRPAPGAPAAPPPEPAPAGGGDRQIDN